MTGIEIAGLLKDYGWPGACAILCVVIGVLYRTLQDSQGSRVTDAKLGTEALTRQASTNAEMATGMQSLRDGQVEIMRIVSLLQRDAENDDERTQEKIKSLTDAVIDLGRRLELVCRGGGR